MNEQKQETKGKEQEGATANPSNGLQPKTVSLNEAIEKGEKLRDEMKAQADRLEKLRADTLLSGTAGGHIETQISPEEIAKKRAQAMADEIVGAFK